MVTNPTQQAAFYPTTVSGSPLPTFSGVVNPITSVPLLYTPTPFTAPAVLVGGWTPLVAGIDYQQMGFTGSSGQVAMVVTRINPRQVALRVYYTPGATHSITDWHNALTDAKAIINGGFFDTSSNALGFIVSNASRAGSPSPRQDTGLFMVSGGVTRVRSLYLEPLQSGEAFDQALQNYPLLMVQGQRAPLFPDLDKAANRRTAIATDINGNILLMVTSQGICTLTDLETWLASSGLGVDTALNLDGGRSTALFLATGGAGQSVPGYSGIPDVIAAFTP